MSQHWTKPLPKSERGEVGRVYFINVQMILPNGETITNYHPFTLNPDQGSTIERMLKDSSGLPSAAKSELLAHHYAELPLSSGAVIKIWFADEAAPDSEELARTEMEKREREKQRPLLFNLDGSRMS